VLPGSLADHPAFETPATEDLDNDEIAAVADLLSEQDVNQWTL